MAKSAYEKVFDELKKIILKTRDLEGQFAFQFNIEGDVKDGAGTFFMKFSDGELSVEPYDYTDNTGVFKASADTFRKLLTGALDPADAIASGDLKVENNEAGAANIFRHIASFQSAKKETKAAPAKKEEKAAAEKKEEKPAPAKKEAKAAPAKKEAKPAAKAAPAAKTASKKKANK